MKYNKSCFYILLTSVSAPSDSSPASSNSLSSFNSGISLNVDAFLNNPVATVFFDCLDFVSFLYNEKMKVGIWKTISYRTEPKI